MHVVSVINYKGGVGKTSLTANLAAELAFRGKKILLLDLDAQASLTFSMISPDEWQDNYAAHKTIKSWFDSADSIHKCDNRTGSLGWQDACLHRVTSTAKSKESP